jgi:hypothetical protein
LRIHFLLKAILVESIRAMALLRFSDNDNNS